MYQLTGKLPLLFPSLSVHLTWTTPQITNPFPYSLSLASCFKNMFTLSFTNSVSKTTLSPLLNLAFFHIGPLHQPCSLQTTLFAPLQTNISVGACFLDLKKAFDSVPHKMLIYLLSSLHFPPYLINWLHSYLSACSKQVTISGISSSPLPVTYVLFSLSSTLMVCVMCPCLLHRSFFSLLMTSFFFCPINSLLDFYCKVCHKLKSAIFE